MSKLVGKEDIFPHSRMPTTPAGRVMQVGKSHGHSQGLGGGLLQSQDIGKVIRISCSETDGKNLTGTSLTCIMVKWWGKGELVYTTLFPYILSKKCMASIRL